MSTERWLLAGPVEIPTRHSSLIAGVIRAAQSAGLPVDSARTIKGDPTQDQLPISLTEDALNTAVLDPTTQALVLEGRQPQWSLSFPLERGFVWGQFETAAVPDDPRAMGALCATVFDVLLCEWGLAGAESQISSALKDVQLPAHPTAPNALPAVAQVTYLSPDLAHQVDLAGLAQAPNLRRLRSVQGGMLLLAEPGALKTLPPILHAAMRPAARPPVDVYPQPSGRPILLRDTSPGLNAWQAHVCGAALSYAHLSQTSGTDYSLAELSRLDAGLGPMAGQLPAPVLEGWSAYAGMLLVNRGGRWRRLLDPWATFPANLVVMLPGNGVARDSVAHNVLFNPHAELMRQVQSSAVVGLAHVVETL